MTTTLIVGGGHGLMFLFSMIGSTSGSLPVGRERRMMHSTNGFNRGSDVASCTMQPCGSGSQVIKTGVRY
jgi:hypothetical protein